jgi:5-(carboxyamino)imidazole ribonucleotide mutase
MPKGIPVAAVAINGAVNAGILAAQILSLSDSGIAEKLLAFKDEMKAGVEKKAKRLEEIGYEKYLSS